ncbi:MAG: cation diffusion facilitator family transporter [bacterium]|nr:cation diffusion facilitator family transporter [bacterium]
MSGRRILNEAAQPLYREVTWAASIGLVVNLVLGVSKLVAGVVTSSFALMTDAVNSLGDVLTTIAVMVAIHFAQKPPDETHPYGHTRAEAVAGVNVALLVLISALALGYEAICRITEVHPLPPLWTLLLAGANVAIKEALYRYKIRVGQRTKSSAIIAHAWDHRSDAFSSLAVLLGLGAVYLGGDDYIFADEVAALFVVAAIAWSSSKLFRSSASELMDAQADSELIESIRRVAQEVPEVKGVETLWVRKSGIEYLADIHIEVDPELSVRKGHIIGHKVRDLLLERFVALRDVLVHLEPWGE